MDNYSDKDLDKLKSLVHDWVLPHIYRNNELCMSNLYENPGAIEFIKYIYKTKPNLIFWEGLSKNPHPEAFKILMENKDEISWRGFLYNSNPDAFQYLIDNVINIYNLRLDYYLYHIIPDMENNRRVLYERNIIMNLSHNNKTFNLLDLKESVLYNKYKNMIDELIEQVNASFYRSLSENPLAIDVLKSNKNIIFYYGLHFNPNPEALQLLIDDNKLDYGLIWANPTAIDTLIKENIEINYVYLSYNPHPKAVELLKNESNEYKYLIPSNNKNPDVIPLIKKMRPNLSNPILFK
jgi:hypothetical protein